MTSWRNWQSRRGAHSDAQERERRRQQLALGHLRRSFPWSPKPANAAPLASRLPAGVGSGLSGRLAGSLRPGGTRSARAGLNGDPDTRSAPERLELPRAIAPGGAPELPKLPELPPKVRRWWNRLKWLVEWWRKRPEVPGSGPRAPGGPEN